VDPRLCTGSRRLLRNFAKLFIYVYLKRNQEILRDHTIAITTSSDHNYHENPHET
jgi:hypothetical protein